jgi:hypothetical protein
MRAYEFLFENREPPSKPITIRALHKMKLAAKRHEAAENERRAIMRVMYSDPDSEQEKNDLERQRLELEQLRAEILDTNTETANKSAIALHNNAKQGIKSAQKTKQHLTKLVKSALGRELKP